MEFKKLEIKSEENWFKRTIWSAHGKKTLLSVFIGALAGFVLYLVGESTPFTTLNWNDVVPNLIIGAVFGFFVTNNRCAQNRC